MFLHGKDLSVPVLIQTIRRLTKEKVQMASEVSSMLRNQVAERASAKEKAIILQAELDSWTRRLETEKNELQSVLEKELDRRSSSMLRNQVAERASAKEKAIILQPKLDSRTRRLETEKNELQSVLEKEFDRRSSDWSLKLRNTKLKNIDSVKGRGSLQSRMFLYKGKSLHLMRRK
ncbi:hypothetical protein T459_35681 [Capsicum annuum]|uniref:Uncharacterized protein n=1 Tax=Capsicum annuum TaxID=4072 RepID=A0A2G2VWM0_CAPAN|nr:hypothetical protein T459_35681 [Capsicum annuum]